MANLEQQLGEQQNTAETEAAAATRKRISWFEQKALGDYGSIKDQYDAVYREKAEQLTRELLILKDKIDDRYLIGAQKIMLNSIIHRTELTLDIAQSNKSQADLHMEISKGINFIQSLSVPNLIYEHLLRHKKTEVAAFYLDDIGKRGLKLVPDYVETLERMDKGELTEADWKVIVKLSEVFAEPSKDSVENGVAMSLIGQMTLPQRTVLAGRILEHPSHTAILKTLLLCGYLQIAQVTQAVEGKIAGLNPQSDADKIQAFQSELLFFQSKEMMTAQEQVEVAQTQALKKKRRSRHFGESNTARQLLTFRGIGGTILALNGMATIAANVLMNIHQPSQLLNNKSLAIGVAMTGAGLEVSNGMGGLFDKPSTNLAQGVEKLEEKVDGRKAKREQEREMYLQALEHDILRAPKASQIYYQFAAEINSAYSKKRAETHSTKIELTMEEMGLNWARIQEKFQPLDKAETEATLSEWVSRMGKEKSSNWKSSDSQSDYIGVEIRKKYELTPYEKWPEGIAQSYKLAVQSPTVPAQPTTLEEPKPQK